jgi:hypothetical protein
MKTIMRVLMATVVFGASASPSYAATLFDNGPVVNSSGLSLLVSPATIYGVTSSVANVFTGAISATVAENFTVGGEGWNVSSIDFYAYQTQMGRGVYTLDTVTWRVLRGTEINGAALVASGTTFLTNGGLVGYRTRDTDLTNQ